MRRKRVFHEWQHPRDSRGRFSLTGGEAWAKRAVTAFENAPSLPQAKLRGPRIARNAKAAALFERHVPGSGATLSRKHTPPVKSPPNPPGATLMTVEKIQDVGMGKALQVRHDGAWLEMFGFGSSRGERHILLRGKNGERIQVDDAGQQLLTRPHQLEFHEPLTPAQAKRMAGWRADAAKPPQIRVKTIGEENAERTQRELDTAKAALKEATRKARGRANRKYPAKEGYGRYTRDDYTDHETWSEQGAVTMLENQLKYQNGDSDASTQAYLDKPGYQLPVLDGKLNRDRPLAVYGDLLRLDADDQGTFRHAADLELIPAELHAVVARLMYHSRVRWSNPELGRSAGIWLGSKPVSELDHFGRADERPRGWAEDKTFGHVDGVYQGMTDTMIVGVSESSHGRGEHKQPALHEFGHALDAAVGKLLQGNDYSKPGDASEYPEWVAAWQRTINATPDISPYFRQKPPAGAQEMWAEALGEWARARAKGRASDFYTGAPGGGATYLATRGEMAMRSAFRIPKERHDVATLLNAYFEGLMAQLEVDL